MLSKLLWKSEKFLFYLIVLLLPTQLGKHFWPSFSYILGIRIDYLSPTIYFTDILILILLILSIVNSLNNRKKRSNIKDQISNRKNNHSSLRGATKTKQSSLLKRLPRVFQTLAMTLRKFSGNFKFLLMAFFLIMGIIFSKSPFAGFYGLIKIFEFTFFGYYVFRKIKSIKDLELISIILTIGIIFEVLLSIAQYLSQGSIGGIFYFFGERSFSPQTPGIANVSLNGELVLRPYGTFPHPNVLAAYLIIGMTIVISNFKFQISNFKKILFALSLLVGSIAIFLTMSRAAIILWIFILGYFVACYLKSNIKNKFTIYYLIFAIFIIGSIMPLSPIHNRFTSFSFYDESITIRKELVLNSLTIIKEHPLFGAGINNFLINLPDYQKINTGSFFTYLQPVHNIFLLIASETGIIGLIFVIWFIGKTFKRIKSQELVVKKKSVVHNSRFIILSIVLILGFFDHYFLTLQQGQLLFAFVLGLCWSKIKIDSKSKIRDNKFN